MFKTIIDAGCALAAAILITVTPALAHDYKQGDLVITHPWSPETPPGAKVAGGYMRIANKGNSADTLIAVETAVSGAVEVHEMKMDNGIMRMRALEAGLEIKPDETVELKPGGFHVMFINMNRAVPLGERFAATLVFRNAGRIPVDFKIEPRGKRSLDDAGTGAAAETGEHKH